MGFAKNEKNKQINYVWEEDHWSSIANITRIVQYFNLDTLGKMFICAQLSYISMH